MRPRRVLLPAVADKGVISSSAAVAAVFSQLRCFLRHSQVSQAPRRRSPAKKTEGERALKKAKAKQTLKSVKAVSLDKVAVQAAEPAAVVAEVPAVGASEDSHENDATATIATIASTLTSQDGAAVHEVDKTRTTMSSMSADNDAKLQSGHASLSSSAAATTAAETTAATARLSDEGAAVLQRRAERRHLASMQRRFLVGTHAALEGSADCPDPRTRAPRFATEDVTTDHQGKEGAAERQNGNSTDGGSLFRVSGPVRIEAEVDQTTSSATSSELAAAVAGPLLSFAEAVEVFADAFAFTLHTVQPRWRSLTVTTTAPDIALTAAANTSAPYASASGSGMSFLSSPFSIAASPVLASRSPFQRATAMEGTAPLHWLEASFEELCRRAACDLHDKLQRASGVTRDDTSSHSVSAGLQDVDERDFANGQQQQQHQQQRLAEVCKAVREQAMSIVSALESVARAVGSRMVFAMRRQWKREKAAAATRRRKSHQPATTTDAEVKDTLLNTVERVGLEVHLLHVWLSHLCEAAASASVAGDADSHERAPSCVAAVVRQSLSWSELSTEAAVPSIDQLQWMLATAMLERVHVQPYHFHHSRLSAAAQLQDMAAAHTTRSAYVVEAKHCNGLVALLDFALAERDSNQVIVGLHHHQQQQHSEPGSPTTLLDEALFMLLAAFHAVLPTYAALLPPWQRALAVSSAQQSHHPRPLHESEHAVRISTTSSMLEDDINAEDDEDAKTVMRHAETDRDTLLAASPTAVWDVVAEHWARREETVRQEGAMAAVWWLRLLPLWISTATAALQLRVVVAATVPPLLPADVALGVEDNGGKDHRSRDTASREGADVYQLYVNDVMTSLDTVVEKAADLLRDVLRFDRVRYEREHFMHGQLSSLHTGHDPNGHRQRSGSRGVHEGKQGLSEVEAEQSGGVANRGVATNDDDDDAAAVSRARDRESSEQILYENEEEEEDNEGDARSSASAAEAPPPLRRNRGKRSLFYKPLNQQETSVLQTSDLDSGCGGPGNNNSSSSSCRGLNAKNPSHADHRSRFVSRVYNRGGGGSGVAGGSGVSSSTQQARSSSSPHLSAATVEAHQKTSALFDVLVLSSETPILLTHRFGFVRLQQRSPVIEESWAAAAQAKSELWRLLYALPSAATVAAAASRSRNGSWSATQVLLGVLPAAVLSLLPATTSFLSSSATSSVTAAVPSTAPNTKLKGKKAPSEKLSVAVVDNGDARQEHVLRHVLEVLVRAQEMLGLTIFESLDHVLVALAETLLRIQNAGKDLSATARHRPPGEGKGLQRGVAGDAVRAQQQLASVLTIGATTMLADNPLSWEGMNAVWQLRQLRPDVKAPVLNGNQVQQQQQQKRQRSRQSKKVASSSAPSASSLSAAMHAFAVEWTAALTKEIPFLSLRGRRHPSAILANAREILRVLQTPSLVVALPLFARQVSTAALLQSLTTLTSQWRGRCDRIAHNVTTTTTTTTATAAATTTDGTQSKEALLEIYQGLLDVLAADADLRLLCCYAAFVESLYEVHLRLKADHAALIAWADQHLLPLVLPVVVAGLRRSQMTHSAVTHGDLCETTLVLLSPLSRYAANPQVAMSDVLRTHWNQVLLQVSLYCIRMAGRGGAKRATDYGMPPLVLPDLAEAVCSSPSLASTAVWWSATFAHGAEPVFLSLLDCSNAVLQGAPHSIEPRDVDAADGMRAALVAYVTAWDTRVRFGRHNWDAMIVPAEDVLLSTAATTTTQALLTRWQSSCTAVQAFTAVTAAARTAGAEAAPFLASKPAKARQLGYLVRFMEHYLREQERLSRLSDEEMQTLMSAANNGATAVATSAPSLPSAHLPAAAAAPLSDTAPLVLLDFVGHLSSAGGWAMVTWSCNIAETVVKIELRRHRQIPEAARAVAATAILSQIRVVPPAGDVSQLPANLLKSLFSLSDVVGSTSESLLGFYRRSPIQGLLCHPTRDQYRVLTFGLKQATAYVQVDSRKYRASQHAAAAEGDTEVHTGNDNGANGDPVALEDEREGTSRGSPDWSAMGRRVGWYYAKNWADHLSALKKAQQQQSSSSTPSRRQANGLTVAKDHNRDFRYYISCLVCLVDACMESANLYLLRQQGDGEEDIRVVVEAAVVELCRALAGNIQSVLSLTREQRRTCFYREEAELLWASLCVVATVSTVAPRDQKDRFFTPRCAQAIHSVFSLTQRLVKDVMGSDSGGAAVDGSDDVEVSEREASDVASQDKGAAAAALRTRPLSTALVQGAQLLLRDPRSSHRLAIRLAMRQRDRDDMTAVLTAFHVLLTSARLYEPGRALLSAVWARLALELTQPLPGPTSTDVGADGKSRSRKKASGATAALLVAATVPSRAEYGAVLRDLTITTTGSGAHAVTAGLTTNAGAVGVSRIVKSTHKKAAGEDEEEGDDESAEADTKAVFVCDVPTAMTCVVEDAAAIQRERERSLQEAAIAYSRGEGSTPFSYGLWDGASASSALALTSAATQPHFDVAAALESGTVPLNEVLEAAIAHSITTARVAGGRSSFDATTTAGAAGEAGDSDDFEGASGFVRLIREYCQDMRDLLLHVPLRDIASHPQVDALFGCLNLLHGSVRPETENALWRLLTAKWREELLDPCETTFLALQESQLALVRTCRGVESATNASHLAASHAGRALSSTGGRLRNGQGTRAGADTTTTAPPPDCLAPAPSSPTRLGPTSAPRMTAAEMSISAVAQQTMRDQWHSASLNFPHHDDARRLLLGNADAAQARGFYPGELNRDATGIAALVAMPAPIPISVLLALLKTLHRRREEHPPSSAGQRSPYGAQSVAGTAAGGKASPDVSAFREFVNVVLTYTARAFWLLRPRLDDNAWLVWAIVERSMAAYPAEGGVRQQEWDRACRQWRLPTSLDHATATAGQLFSPVERRRIAAWVATVREACPNVVLPLVFAEGKEEVAVCCYMRAMALYLQLLAVAMNLLLRHRLLGDLPDASLEVVRRRLLTQRQRGGGDGEDGSRDRARDAALQELRRLALERQTRPAGVNRNLLEGAALQYVNVAWCFARHADSLTHLATDVALCRLTDAHNSGKLGRSHSAAGVETADAPVSSTSVIAYADDVRLMVAGVLQDTLHSVLSENDAGHLMLMERVAQTLLTSGFSCDPLYLPSPQRGNAAGLPAAADGQQPGSVAPAFHVVATLLSTSASAAAATASSASGVRGSIARAELFVGSPTLLAVLTPHFIKATATAALQGSASAPALLPVTSALEFYLSRRNVPLSPLLEATTELLTSCTSRSSAVHTYCERLASALATRKEFRQALEPPTIASVEQGAAGSIANEVVISFVAAIARQDVHVTKKTLAHLLHFVTAMRPDVFGQPPIANRQGKLTLVQVGTTVETTLDTTNPLYTPKPRRPVTVAARESRDGDDSDDAATTLMEAFNADRLSDFTAVSHRKALAALVISLPTVMEVAMHMEAMRPLDAAEWRRATQMLKAADDARRERVAMHRSQTQVAVQGRHLRSSSSSSSSDGDAPGQVATTTTSARRGASTAQIGKLDASLHLEDPLDFGVAMLHLRYALRKIVHASLRRLLHQQGPRMLAEVATMLQLVDPGMESTFSHTRNADKAKNSNSSSSGKGGPGAGVVASPGSDGRPTRPYDGVLAGTTRVLLSRAVLCAQAIGYDSSGAAIELPPSPLSSSAASLLEPQPVLKLPVPALQPSAVEAAMVALGHAPKARHTPVVGHSSGKVGQLTKEEKAAVHQRVELEREAAVTVGLTTLGVPRRDQQRILRALRNTRRQLQLRQQRRDFNRRRAGQRTSSSSSSFSSLSFGSKLLRESTR